MNGEHPRGPGFYEDPGGGEYRRYWDGVAWTELFEKTNADTERPDPAPGGVSLQGVPEDDGDDLSVITRVCRKCSAQNRLPGEFCPHCGARYVRRSRLSKKQTIALFVSLGVICVAAAGTAAALKVRSDRDASAAAEQRASEADAADEQERREAEEQEAADDREREARNSMVKFLQENITDDATQKVNEGLLEGPILYTQCTPTGGGSVDDLTALTGTFECIAANVEHDDGTIEGYRFTGTINWDRGETQWHLGG